MQQPTMIMQEHPSWRRHGDGHGDRVVRAGAGVWAVCATTGGSVRPVCVTGSAETPPVVDWFAPRIPTLPKELLGCLTSLGTVGRIRNPDLWDALATAIMRQVIRAGQSKALYRRLCGEYGPQVTTPCGTRQLFPTPETVLELPESAYRQLGLAFKRRPLQAAAAAYLEHGEKWAALAPADLLRDVQSVPQIGPWTAGAAVADSSNDWSLYPYGDLAVRTWAKRAAPSMSWPDSEAEFAAVWRQMAGSHLSILTVSTLAWGSLHGDIG